MDPANKAFLDRAAIAAANARHIFPRMAACEAALESTYGRSALAVDDNNLFGTKQHSHPVYGTAFLPTKEFVRGGWIALTASWIHYPGWNACFIDRMFTLERLQKNYAHYANALAARDAETYVSEVSKTWSTDPQRAEKCISIYREYIANAPVDLPTVASV